jgi:twitching motility protein PilT
VYVLAHPCASAGIVARVNFHDLLKTLVERGASDLHLHVGLPPLARVHGKLVPVAETRIGPNFTEKLVDAMCDERQRSGVRRRHQVDLAYSVSGLGRFRVNLFRQRGSVSAVLRIIGSDEATLQIVNLPEETIAYFRDRRRGSCSSPARPAPASRRRWRASSTRSTAPTGR